jgi:hypothetical protein
LRGSLQVAFRKVDDGRLCAWVATPAKRKRFQGTTMAAGRDLPHDLAQFVVEETFGLQRGFWGLVAKGATFKSVPGRRRTQPGRQLVRENHAALQAAEHLVNTHVSAWRTGAPTPAAQALDAMLARWRALPVGEDLLLDWLTPPARRSLRGGPVTPITDSAPEAWQPMITSGQKPEPRAPSLFPRGKPPG